MLSGMDCYNQRMGTSGRLAVLSGVFLTLGFLAPLRLFPAQQPAAPASGTKEKEPSHTLRFADPRSRLLRGEEEANARLRVNPEDVAALVDRGVARLRLGNLADAADDFERAAALAPASADVQTHLAYGRMLQGRAQPALEAARKALALNPDHSSAHYYAGLLLSRSGGDLPQVIQHFERAVELNPDQTEIRFDLLSAYRQRGDATRAGLQLRLLRTVLPPHDPRLLYAEGLLAADRGSLSQAIDRFRQALAAAPRLNAARMDLGMALVQSERWLEAVEVLGPMAQEQAHSFTAAYFHALALQNTQRGTEAEQEVRRALALDPQSASAHTLLGIVLAGRGAHGDAVTALENAIKLEPQSFDAWYYLGRARYALRELSGARDAFRAALERKTADAGARFFFATVLETLGEKDAALEQYRALVNERPQDVRGYVGLGNLLDRYGQLEEALVALRRAREIDPQNFEAALGLGRALGRAGQWEQAIPFLREAVARVPESAEAHYQLALALRRLGLSDEAAREFAIVERLNREYRTRGTGMPPPSAPPSGGL